MYIIIFPSNLNYLLNVIKNIYKLSLNLRPRLKPVAYLCVDEHLQHVNDGGHVHGVAVGAGRHVRHELAPQVQQRPLINIGCQQMLLELAVSGRCKNKKVIYPAYFCAVCICNNTHKYVFTCTCIRSSKYIAVVFYQLQF